VVLELQEESVDPTNPFSSSYIHHRLENDAREGDGSERSSKTNSFSNSVIEARIRTSKQQGASQLRQGYPIASLASTHLDCRLLFQPAEVDGIEIPGAESVTLLPLEVQSTESTGGVQCFVIRESPEHTSCYIAKPFPYVMYFDPYHDSVVVSNQAEFPLHIKPSRPAKPTETESDDIGSVSELTISPYSNGLLAIGSWILGTPDVSCVFQVKIFPRTRVLEVMALSLRHIAGSKRDATGQDAVDEPRMDSSTVTRQVGCLSELVDGEVARFSAPYKEKDSNFTLFRMRRIGETKSAIVFQARHSGYSKQIIVVKAFKRSSGRDAVVRAKSWHNEHKIHLGIQSVGYAPYLLLLLLSNNLPYFR
jgi:hypothetical protein